MNGDRRGSEENFGAAASSLYDELLWVMTVANVTRARPPVGRA